MRGSAWPRPRPIIELVLEGICPECGGSLDTGWECNYWDCNFDGEPMILAHNAQADTHAERRDVKQARPARVGSAVRVANAPKLHPKGTSHG